ncbi:MAG TPA: ABC transporter ATP-binding protein [Acidimicrobiales bacterium]|nr:ABC transporter ATP-binding protein [Acidimicrobiales bacterium]
MLDLRNVWKSFDGQDVLRGIDLAVTQGEFVSFIGHSGCGKSTLLNVVGGLLDADSGEVSLDGKEITGPGPDRAMVFQNYSLLPRLSLLANVREAARAARPQRKAAQNDEVVERYLRAVGLWDHKDKRPAQVSGGMQQRTAVARAFAVGPRLLLLDEPFGALDALTRARLQQQLIELWQHESETETVLMVTHGIDEAILLADRIVVMANPPSPSILDVIPVDLPRPRDRTGVIGQPAFRVVQERLMALLTAEEPAAA